MESKVWKDEILEELYQARLEILRECDFDLEKLFAKIREREQEHKDLLVKKESSPLFSATS